MALSRARCHIFAPNFQSNESGKVKLNPLDFTNTRDASAAQMIVLIDKKNVFPAWDVNFPIIMSGVINGQSSLLGGFGQLNGPGDYRASVGVNFTRLQALTLGMAYNAYIGSADTKLRPIQDRDNISFSAKYNF